MLTSWGRFPRAECRVIAPQTRDEAVAALANLPSVIARGNGHAYGDAALNPDATLTTRSLTRVIAFDTRAGVLEAEAGILLDDILDVVIPRGWFPAVAPGIRFVTLGGMIAADVHGRNAHKAGSFGAYVESLDLALADGSVRRCSRSEDADLFMATIGGMGLTGLILSARLRLQPIETAYMRQETLRAVNIDAAIERIEASSDWTYKVAWIDCLAQGAALGRAVVYRSEHARLDELSDGQRHAPLEMRKKPVRRVPIDLPNWTINRWSVKALNWLYYRRAVPGTAVIDYDTCFYPLDRILEWNRVYGPAGFVNYQCALPRGRARAGLAGLLERIAASGAASSLSVLKSLGPGTGMLAFPIDGYSLAVDFRITPTTLRLMAELDTIVMAHGGRIYLAKDARMPPAMLRQGYPALDEFEAVRQRVDPGHKFTSLQSQRLGL